LIGVISPDQAIERFEREIKEYFGVRYVFPVSSGKAALTLILEALQSLCPRREVIIPSYTCYSVPSAVMKAGLNLSLCDIDPKTFDLDLQKLEGTITEETLCVIPSHLFGIPSAMDEITRLARRNGAYVLEDAAQAMGGTDGRKKLGTIGDVGFFSFGRGKNVTCGSGGLIVTNSQSIAGAIAVRYANLPVPGILEMWKDFLEAALMTMFIHPQAYWFPAGLPFLKLGETVYYKDFPIKKLSGMKAGLLRQWQMRLDQSNGKRVAVSSELSRHIRCPGAVKSEVPYLRFPLLVQSREIRDRLLIRSSEGGLGVGRMYPTSINEVPEIRSAFKDQCFPGASEVAERLLTLPTHPLVDEKDTEAVIALVKEAIRPDTDPLSGIRKAMVRC
jgi:dTDP-4-amino-4,6-dideoxygalactose transaminase